MATRSDFLADLAKKSGLTLRSIGDPIRGRAGRSAEVIDAEGNVVTTLSPSRTESAYNKFTSMLENEFRGYSTPLRGHGNIVHKDPAQRPMSDEEFKKSINPPDNDDQETESKKTRTRSVTKKVSNPAFDNLPDGFIRFNTPSGAVLAVKEGNNLRAATGSEAVKIAMGQVKASTVTAKSTSPFEEFASQIEEQVEVEDSAGSSSGTARDVVTNEDENLENTLSSANLSEDQKQAIRTLYDAVSENDRELVTRYAAALEAGRKFADPFFKAMTRIVESELIRGIEAQEGDLEFETTLKQQLLNDIREDVSFARENLSLEEQAELRQLEREYETNVETLQNNMARSGFTSSTRRARKEQLLEETTGDIRESTKRRFGVKERALDTEESRAERNTQQEIERLRELTERGIIGDIRGAEERLGSDRVKELPVLGGRRGSLIGGLPGTIEQDRARDAASFANQFIF